MAHIKRFRVEGLAGRKRALVCTLNDDINVFFGLNGSGKTTLLKILFAALRNETKSLEMLPFKAATVEFYSKDRGATITRTISRASGEVFETSEVFDPDTGSYAINSEPRKFPAQWTSTGTEEGAVNRRYRPTLLTTARLFTESDGQPRVYARTLRDQGSEDQFDLLFAEHVTNLWRRYTTRILREVRTTQEEGIAEILYSVIFPSAEESGSHDLDPQTALVSASAFLDRQNRPINKKAIGRFRRRFDEDPSLRSIVSDVHRIETEIERIEAPREQLASLIEEFFTTGKEVRFTDRGIHAVSESGEEIPLQRLSSGEKQLLRILLEVIQSESSIVMIDEPELSMHIDWQGSLIQAISVVNQGNQVIMATHSPDVMSDLDDSKIFRV